MKAKQTTKNSSSNNNLDLKELLKEADKITLDDLDFNKILKEQTNILCNIQKMIHYENNANIKEPFKCNITNLKNDKNLQIMINKYKNNKHHNNKINFKKKTKLKTVSNYKNSKKYLYKKSTSSKKKKPSYKKSIYKLNNKTSKNNYQNNSKYFDISGTIKLQKHQ